MSNDLDFLLLPVFSILLSLMHPCVLCPAWYPPLSKLTQSGKEARWWCSWHLPPRKGCSPDLIQSNDPIVALVLWFVLETLPFSPGKDLPMSLSGTHGGCFLDPHLAGTALPPPMALEKGHKGDDSLWFSVISVFILTLPLICNMAVVHTLHWKWISQEV